VGDISQSAGVAHGTFYVHFESKEAVADALLEQFNSELARKLAPVLSEASSDPEAAARIAARTFLKHLHRDRPLAHWYAERLSAGGATDVYRSGINPAALELLSGAIAAFAGHSEADELDRLASHALLAMWLRVGLQSLSETAPTMQQTEELLAKMSAGAIGALRSIGATPPAASVSAKSHPISPRKYSKHSSRKKSGHD
jgi:AcrR family transcriptional regulator